MKSNSSYESALAVLKRAWSNAGIASGDRQGAMFALRGMRFDVDTFEEIVEAMRLMPDAEKMPSLEVIQLVWRIPTQMLMYRGRFADRADIAEYDQVTFDVLIEATRIIGVQLNQAEA